jgi:uncharacterized membrane protein HdeD (DUF308 family)
MGMARMNENRDRRQPLAAGLSGRLGDMWWAFMLRGVFAAVLGLCALIWPSVSLALLIALVGLYCLADGVAGLLGAWRAAERGPNLLQALLGIAVGAILLLWPGASIRVLLVVFGVWALFTGVSQIVAARREHLESNERGVMTTTGGIAAALGLILIVWPGTGVVAISWVIAVVALLLAALLIFLALRLKRLQGRVDTFARQRQ